MSNKAARRTLIVLLWLVLWQLASIAVNNNILLAGPYEALLALIRLGATSAFWLSVISTVLKITLGFATGLMLGCLCAALSYRYGLFREVISLPVSVIKSVPVASFVILVLIWAGAPSLSIVISALVVFPMIYYNVLSGLDSTDRKMIETSELFRFRFRDKVNHIYLPSVIPHLRSAVAVSAGMAFKSGIAAEVIGRPLKSIGSGLYQSKVLLATDELFAWTFCAVLLAFLFEKAITTLMRRLMSR
ncbi:MAG: ABC transporter permease subunit [Clostridiales bacterium]|nr:ABC transporter permease subunit [Clostridiales bacterium]